MRKSLSFSFFTTVAKCSISNNAIQFESVCKQITDNVYLSSDM